MANNTEDIKWLYDKLKAKGYDIGSQQEFTSSLADEADRDWYYDKAVGMGLNVGSKDDFNALYAPAAPAAASALQTQPAQPTQTAQPQATAGKPVEAQATGEQAAAQPTWQPTEQEKIRMAYNLNTIVSDFNKRSRARVEQSRRVAERYTPEGRNKLKAAKFQAQLAGTPTQVLGLTPDVSPAPANGEVGGATGNQPKPLLSGQGPVPYGVVEVDGQRKTQWLLPDGTLTTDFAEADKAEYGARRVRLMNQFVGRMKENGLDPTKQDDVQQQAQLDMISSITSPLKRDGVAEDLWKEAEDKYKTDREASAEKHWNNYAAMGGGREMRVVTAAGNRHDDLKSHMTRFDLQAMMDKAWARVGDQLTANCYNQLRRSDPGATEDELRKAASEWARQLSDMEIYDYAVEQNAPKSTLEFFGRKVADANLVNSLTKGLARMSAGTPGDLAAYQQAMEEYGKNHRAADIGGTVVGMAIDPTTWISGGMGSLAGKGALNLGGRFLASRTAGMTAQMGERLFSSSLAGRILTGMAAGSANLGTFEAMKEGERQFMYGGYVNPETGEVEGYSLGAILNSGVHGSMMGAATGIASPLIGNVADKTVKATTSTAGKVAMRGGEQLLSTVAEGTIFSIPEWINGEQDAFDVWTDNMAMMAGFKLSHAATAPAMIRSLRPVKPTGDRPLTRDERIHNNKSFSERLRERMDASPFDIALTGDEREELRRRGYGELSDLFAYDPEYKSRKAPQAQDAEGDYVGVKGLSRVVDYEPRLEGSGNPEFDGYEAMERLMEDSSVSEATRAKAYYILTGRQLPMSTVTGWTMDKDEDGNIIVSSLSNQGAVVTSRRFKSDKQAQQEIDRINRQSELNTIDIGEQYRNAEARQRVMAAAIHEISPEADPQTVYNIYEAARRGDKNVTEDQRAMADMIDEAIERNSMAGDEVSPEGIRRRVSEETGVDIDKAIRKEPGMRTEAEQEAVKKYARALFPEEEAYEPTPEQAEADRVYEDSRLLYGRFEQGDPEAQAEFDAISLRMTEAHQLCEEAFGDETEVYMAQVKENPWGVLSDPNLTPDQRDAVLYYINANAALDGVLDASNEAAADKRQKVQEEVEHRTHKERGVIVPATLKIDDTPTYIIKGDVALFSDGSGVDVRNSSDTIIILDEQGEYKFISPDQIMSVGEAIDPQTELQTAYEAIDREQEEIFGVELPERERMQEDAAASEAAAPPQNEEAAQTEGFAEAEAPAQEQNNQPTGPTPEATPEAATPSALERVPVSEETGDPVLTHESVDAETAWDAAMEFFGTPEDALSYVQSEISNAKTAITAAEKGVTKIKPTGGMTKYRDDLAKARAQVETSKANLAKWEAIAEVQKRRKSEENALRAAERAEEQAKLHDEAVARFEEEQRIKAEKQAEQEAIGTHAVNPKIREKWTAAPKVDGHSDIITLPDGSTLAGHYVMTEAKAASASHDPDTGYEPTEGFPIDANGQSVNDRDYKRDIDAQRIVQSMADAYDSRAMQTPVIVSKDGIVLSGNNRTMSGDIAAAQGTDGAYLEYLNKYGRKFGFTPEQVGGMKHPRVVFVPDDDLPYDASTFSRFNAQEMKSQSKPEAAIKLGKIVDDAVFNRIVADLNRYDRLSDFYADQEAAARTIGELVAAGAINDKQLPELRTGTALSAAGKELIENTLIGKTFQREPEAVRMIISLPTLRQAAILGLGEIANNRTLASKGYDLSNELSAAVDLVFRAKTSLPDIYKDGMPVSPFGRQQGLFDDEYGESRVTDATTLLLADLLNSGKPNDVRKVLSMYNQSAQQSAAGVVDIFSESGKPDTKEEILTRVNEHFRNATPKEQQALVEAAIEQRKREAEAVAAEQAGRGDASHETESSYERSADPERSAVEPERPAEPERNHAPEEEALLARVEVTENDWEEEGRKPDEPIYKREIIIDGKHSVTQVDAPDEKGTYSGSYFEYDGKRFGFIGEVADYIDKQPTAETEGEEKPIIGLDGYSRQEVRDIVSREVEQILSDADIDAEIVGIEIHGSRGRGDARPDSDLDIVLEYRGDVKEYAMFNAINEAPIEIEGIQVDVNPIRAEETGTLADYMEKSKAYDEEKLRTPSTSGEATPGSKIAEAEATVNTTPTDAQKEAGNYKKGRVPKYDRTIPATPEAQRSAIAKIVEFAKKVKDKVERVVIGGITKRQAKDFAEQGIEVDNAWVHSFESSAVSHNQKHHGNEKAEASRGQIAITAEDYGRIPEILEAYDKVSKSSNKTKGTENEVIIYEKGFDDGYVYYLEEKRDNRKSLAFHTMYKKKKGTDSSDGFAVKPTAPITPIATPDNLSSNSDGKDDALLSDKQASGAKSSKGYTITPATYTNKKGKTSNVWHVKFDRDLTTEEKAALNAFIQEPLEAGRKTSRGWLDRKNGIYIMRSEEAARELAAMIGNEEAVADAQPLTAEDYQDALEAEAEAPTREQIKEDHPTPMNRITPDQLLPEEPETKKVKATPAKSEKPAGKPADAPKAEQKGQFKVDDEMRGMEDELRSLLGIDDSEGDRGDLFRNPEDFTNKERMQITSLGITYALKYFDQGIISFPDFADKMVRRMGEKIRPWLKAFYGGARDIPGYDHLPFTPADEVKAFDVMNFDKANKDADPMRTAQGIVAEQRAEEAISQGQKEIKELRNQKRKENEKQIAADTDALAAEAEAIASEAEARLEEYTEKMKAELAEKEAKYADIDATVEAADDIAFTSEDDEEEPSKESRLYREMEAADEILNLEPIEVEPNNMTRAELRAVYNSLPSVVKDGREIEFYHSAFKKIYKEGGLFGQIVPVLDEVLEQSVLAYSEEDNLGGTTRPDGTIHKAHENIESFDNYIGKVSINGDEYYVRSTVQNEKGHSGTHAFFVSNVEVYKNPTESRTIPITSRGTTDLNGIVDTKLQQFFEKINFQQTKKEMEGAVTLLSDKLHTPIRVVSKQEAEAEGYGRKKGWYDRETGAITIVADNHRNVGDIVDTAVHETVGHNGLRQLFGTETQLNNFLDEAYRISSDKIREEIDRRTERMMDAEVERLQEQKRKEHEELGENPESEYYADMAKARIEAETRREQIRRDATEEYAADLGMKIGEEGFERMDAEELTFWGKMKGLLQKALDRLLAGLKLPKMRRWTDKEWSYVLWKSWRNLREGNNRYQGPLAEAEDITRRERSNFGADESRLFRDADMGLEEAITKMKADAAAANSVDFAAKQAAMRAIGGNLSKLRQAMARQREYDITTVKAMTDLSKTLLEAGLLDDPSKYETNRILSAIKNAVGKQDTSKQVQTLMDIVVDNQLRMGANYFGKLLNVKGSHVDARGIEVQGALDPEGQKIAQVVRKSTSLPKDDIDNHIADAINRMGSTDQALADEAAIEYAGLQIAHQYAEEIRESKNEEKELRKSIEEAEAELKLGRMDKYAFRQYKEATEDAIRQNKIDRAESYRSLSERLGGGVLGESVERAKAWREAEKQRVEEIHHNANSDMEGRPTNEHHKADRVQKLVNNGALRFLLAPLGTFDQMLRMFGRKSVRGEGYLWNRYMRGWVDCTEKEYTGYQEALKELDRKVSEVFGKDMNWGDLFAMERRMPKASVSFRDGGEMRDHELTQGNLLYIYMADKMTDGRMKLRRMGITEDDVERIKGVVDPRFIELADWMQEEFLTEKRNEYNEVHKRMFGTSMAAIENYFPLKILANARMEEVDVADDTTDTALPATSTGSIIKRKRNNLALDVTGADAFSVILDHIQQMERWASFAEYNRDLNTLLSYKRFRNQVMNMTSAYGAGKTLWTNFRNVAAMAAGAYRPPIAPLDKAAVNIAKGATMACVNMRIFTALKQFLSMPAYIPDSNPIYLAANIVNPVGAWKWSMENLPLFEKRWKSRMAGDPRLMKTDMDWKMWRSRIVEIAGRVGMSPNAFVDALTVAIGARSMYQTKLAKYKRQGYPLDAARKRAKQDATILFNQTQQSSEGSFLSTMQADRSWLSTIFTIFRNSSMSYSRQCYDAMRNLGHRLKPGYKGMTEEFMAKQMRRDGIDPDKADYNAKQEYRRGIIRDIVRVGIFGFGLQYLWNLGAYGLYLLFGENVDEKDKMWDDVWNHTMLGSVEGLTGGDVMSAAGQMWLNGEGNPEQLTKEMPLAGEITTILSKMDKDYVSALNDVVNLLVQSGLGFNPQSLTDAAVAVMDCGLSFRGEEAQTSRECALLIARIINCPQSQIDKIYFDEIDATGEEAATMTPEEIAERYAEYKTMRNAPLTGWAYGEKGKNAAMEKHRKKAKTTMKERMSSRAMDERTRELLDSFEEVSEQEREINKLKKSGRVEDREAYRAAMKELRESTDLRRHNRVKRYNHDIKRLTERWLNAKTAEEADSLARAMVRVRERLLEDLDETGS